jgi:hypothetical protein
MTVRRFAAFVLAHLFHRFFVRGGIGSDRDVGGHAAHGEGAALMANANAGKRIGPHEGSGHGDLGAVGHQEFLAAGELFDIAEQVIPATAV